MGQDLNCCRMEILKKQLKLVENMMFLNVTVQKNYEMTESCSYQDSECKYYIFMYFISMLFWSSILPYDNVVHTHTSQVFQSLTLCHS